MCVFLFLGSVESAFDWSCECSPRGRSRGYERHDDIAATGQFEARFWNRIFEEEVGRVKGHFGPLNTYVDETFSLRSPRLISENSGSQYTLQGRATPLEERTVSYVCIILMRATSRHAHMVKQKFSTRVIVV
jgi:hypothetical protein